MAEVYQRDTGQTEEEKIFGKGALHFTCETKIGRFLTSLILKRKFVSKIAAYHYKTRHSAKMISAFLEKYHIDQSQLSKQPEEYRSFNEFFTRKLNCQCENNPDLLISPADSRLIVHKIEEGSVFSVKGQLYTVAELLATAQGTDPLYEKGLCLVFRLCPTDYHRFCFPDSGTWDEITPIKGYYNTVNTFFSSSRVHVTNYREKTILHTENFGNVAFVEVGAMLIGKIVQTAECPGHFTKGQEKGYFEYGASTIVMIIEEGRVCIDRDILEQSARGIECVVKYGEAIGRKL